jgi:hypothetical protein
MVDGTPLAANATSRPPHVLTDPSGSRLWVVGGRYEFALDRAGGWHIAALT